MGWQVLIQSPNIEIPITAASLRGTVTDGAGDVDQLPERAELAGGLNYDYIAFDDTTEQNAYFQYSIPSGWNEGTLTWRYKWTNPDGLTTEDLVMGLSAVAIGDNGDLDVSFGTEVTITDDWQAQDFEHISPESGPLTVGGTPSEGDMIMFNLARKTGSDDLTGDSRIMELIITFTRESVSD